MFRRLSAVAAVAALAATAFGVFSAPGATAAVTTSISGTVRSAPAGFAFGDITVMVLKPTPSGGQLVGSALSGSDGKYVVTGLTVSGPAGYIVCFTPGPTNAFISTCYANSGTFTPFPNGTGVYYDYPAGSAPVVVSAAHPAAKNIDGFIYPSFDPFTQYGSVSGKVTDLFGAPLSFVKVWAINAAGTKVDTTVTSKQGAYTLAHAPIPPFGGGSSAPFVICFDGSSASGGFTLGAFGKRCYKNVTWSSVDSAPPATSTTVTVVPNATTTGINIKLPATP
jgi:hypothetical protein